ncbi:hypothetical protein SK128_015288 [Halocaridina rubra]|uniref:Plasminogen receptor (KT) n=1 Tax=Halocaridina rubra TaxID=373956 RepID=A0AAN9AGS7_HALRR
MGSNMSSHVQQEVREGQLVVTNMKNDMISQQVQLIRRMAERQMALQVAAVRECLLWFVPFTVASYIFLYKGYKSTKSWPVTFPLVPITFALGYQLHYAYGNKTNKIKVLAEKIMSQERHMMAVPEWSTSQSYLMQSTNIQESKVPEEQQLTVEGEMNAIAASPHKVTFVSPPHDLNTSSKLSTNKHEDNSKLQVPGEC